VRALTLASTVLVATLLENEESNLEPPHAGYVVCLVYEIDPPVGKVILIISVPIGLGLLGSALSYSETPDVPLGRTIACITLAAPFRGKQLLWPPQAPGTPEMRKMSSKMIS
jgi:hypothetical protein